MIFFLVTLAVAATVLTATHVWRGVAEPRRDAVSLGVLLTYATVLYLQPFGMIVSDLLVIAAAVAGGTLLARALSGRGAIAAFCITMAAVDLLSFGGGLTRTIIEGYASGRSELLRYLAFTIVIEERTTPLVGIGDLLALAALYGGLLRIDVPAYRAGLTLLGGLAAALAIGLRAGGAPALPFLAGAVLLLLAGLRVVGGDAEEPRGSSLR
jgi:hypothetical protein